MTRKKLRTVVCGSTFGQFYLEALKLLPTEFELAGLLAKGSKRSENCARYYGTKLYTEASQLPDDIDLACVVLRSGVMGGKGTELSLRLLERGIHVIQELPMHHKDMAACLKAAHQKNVLFQTGDFYVHLPAVKRFVACAKVMLERQNALYIDAAFASQVSYPLMHIFLEALPSIRPWQTGTVSRDAGPFQVLTGTVGKIPVILRVHNEVDPDDPDNHLHLLHRITIGCEGGSLTLTDTHGPVIWQPRLHIPENLNVLGDLAGAHIDHMLESSTEILGISSPANYRDILTRQWPRAIASDLSLVREMILGNVNAAMRAQQELLCSRQWQEMTAALGYPVLRPGCSYQPLPVNILQAAAATIPDDNVQADAGGICFYAKTDLASCTEYAESELQGIQPDSVKLFAGKINEAVYRQIIYALQTLGILTDKERAYNIAEIIAASNTVPRHHYLIRRWLALLSEHGYIHRNGDYFYGTDAVQKETVAACWREVRNLWDGKLGSPLTMDYLLRNAELLPQLMSGEQQATLLLFPEGKMEYANACYRDVMARYLNKALAEAVIRIQAARKTTAEGPLRIVEIGAGTGATTHEVVPRLKTFAGAFTAEYLYTDVSNFFLTGARERFKDCPWMRFQVVDIDKDFTQQGLQTAGADIIIAAGVLDNAFNIDKTVAGLMRILADKGWLLITEPVRDFPEMLISQAFMRPDDGRENAKTIFKSAKQWQDIFYKAGAAEFLVLPGEDHLLDPLGQKLFAVSKSNPT